MSLSTAQVAAGLTRLGFRTDSAARLKQSIIDFQGGWFLGPILVVDGIAGPKTQAALATSLLRQSRGQSTASDHFSFSEFLCHCGGRYASCRRYAGEGVLGHRENVGAALLLSLERLRAAFYPHGLAVVSGYRCDGYNQAAGGAANSQHRFGAACDLAPVAPTAKVVAMHQFSGVGWQGATGLVRHVDRRDVSGCNPTHGTTPNPTQWIYS